MIVYEEVSIDEAKDIIGDCNDLRKDIFYACEDGSLLHIGEGLHEDPTFIPNHKKLLFKKEVENNVVETVTYRRVHLDELASLIKSEYSFLFRKSSLGEMNIQSVRNSKMTLEDLLSQQWYVLEDSE